MRIGDRQIGLGHEPYVIAEIGVNHDGAVDRALSLTRAAASAGADAVKLQFFETDLLMSRTARLASYQADAGETDPFAMLHRLELSIEDMAPVVDLAHELRMHAIVTVFSVELVERAESLAWDAYKSASPDIVHRPLLEAVAGTGRPLIVSTGASTENEISAARSWLDDAADRLAFLHCVSSYPTPPEEANVAACAALADLIRPCPVGYSDHTTRTDTGFVARHAGGACILEKHLTDDCSRPGPDHQASLEPDDFAEYVRWARLDANDWTAEPGVDHRLAGNGSKLVAEIERDVRSVSRQSIVAARRIAAGSVITRDEITFKRPGSGLEPWRLGEVVGMTATRTVEPDEQLLPDAILRAAS